MRQQWAADVLRAAGLTVVETDGWQTRGSTTFVPRGIVWHHTASSPTITPDRMAAFLIRGRSDLPGPLSQFMLDRTGRWWMIAAGRANHAGAGSWKGLAGNTSVFGVEACNSGKGEPWPAVQVESYVTGTAALCHQMGINEQWVCGHKEWAPGRKIDPAGLDMDAMRQRIKEAMMFTPDEARFLKEWAAKGLELGSTGGGLMEVVVRFFRGIRDLVR